MTSKFLSATFLMLCLVLGANAQTDEGYRIAIEIDGYQDEQLFLGYPFGEKKYLQDTTTINADGEYVFEGDKNLTGGIYFVYAPDKVYFEIIVSNQKFAIETDTTDFIANMKVKGSPENELFRDFRSFMRDNQQKAQEINKEMNEEGVSEDKKKALQDELHEISKKIEAYRQEIVSKHPESLVAEIIKSSIEVEVPDTIDVEDKEARFTYYKTHYFDNLSLNDPRMLRTPFFHQKVMDYLEKLTVPHPDSIAKSAEYIIQEASSNEETYRYWVVTLTNKYETSNVMGMDAVFVQLVERYYLSGEADWADSTLVNKLDKRVRELKPNLIGKQAPPLPLNDIDGNPRPLSKVNADYTIVYFYDPDCGHCKKKTPELKKLYDDVLKAKGIEVYAVNINPETEKWKSFVEKDDLTFINVIDERGYRGYYDVRSTPKVYLLDKDKKIIGKQLDIEQIEGFIDRYSQNMQ